MSTGAEVGARATENEKGSEKEPDKVRCLNFRADGRSIRKQKDRKKLTWVGRKREGKNDGGRDPTNTKKQPTARGIGQGPTGKDQWTPVRKKQQKKK